MNLAFAPLFQRLARSRRIMVAGCGGGFDVYCGLPLYLYLRPRAQAVFLANLSFTSLEPGTGQRLAPGLTAIDAASAGADEYFPERSLCRWLRAQGLETPIYCFSRTGVKTLVRGWRRLVEQLELDAIVLADGGTDSLMRGDEAAAKPLSHTVLGRLGTSLEGELHGWVLRDSLVQGQPGDSSVREPKNRLPDC